MSYENDEGEPEHALDAIPQHALECALRVVMNPDSDEPPPSKCLILLLWDDDPETYAIRQINAGLTQPEAVALLEAAKFDCLKELRDTE